MQHRCRVKQAELSIGELTYRVEGREPELLTPTKLRMQEPEYIHTVRGIGYVFRAPDVNPMPYPVAHTGSIRVISKDHAVA